MSNTKTHFEQVAVETVKKIVQNQDKDDRTATGNERAVAETQAEKSQERWREVAKRVQQEQDPKVMIGLVEQLIATFDQEQRGNRLPLVRNTGSGLQPPKA